MIFPGAGWRSIRSTPRAADQHEQCEAANENAREPTDPEMARALEMLEVRAEFPPPNAKARRLSARDEWGRRQPAR